MVRLVRECGGLCIADEVQTGLGRLGSHYWSFLTQEVSPDIVIIGKTLGEDKFIIPTHICTHFMLE